MAARLAHNQEAAGSNPASATIPEWSNGRTRDFESPQRRFESFLRSSRKRRANVAQLAEASNSRLEE